MFLFVYNGSSTQTLHLGVRRRHTTNESDAPLHWPHYANDQSIVRCHCCPIFCRTHRTLLFWYGQLFCVVMQLDFRFSRPRHRGASNHHSLLVSNAAVRRPLRSLPQMAMGKAVCDSAEDSRRQVLGRNATRQLLPRLTLSDRRHKIAAEQVAATQ